MILLRNIVFVLALAGLVTACGVRGPLELPPGISDDHNKEEKTILDGLI